MTPGAIDRRLVADRLATIAALLGDIWSHPLDDDAALVADRRNLWTIESCLRRSVEALFDIGRHLLAKGYGCGVSEYREIADRLGELGILTIDEASLMARMASYRNRLVHMDHDVDTPELVQIARHKFGDIERLADAYRR